MTIKILDNQDLDKVSGGVIDTTKKYTFYKDQTFRSKTDRNVGITITDDYINVPYDTKVSVIYFDKAEKYSTNTSITCFLIENNFITDVSI